MNDALQAQIAELNLSLLDSIYPVTMDGCTAGTGSVGDKWIGIGLVQPDSVTNLLNFPKKVSKNVPDARINTCIIVT